MQRPIALAIVGHATRVTGERILRQIDGSCFRYEALVGTLAGGRYRETKQSLWINLGQL